MGNRITVETASGRRWATHGGLQHLFGYRRGSICGNAPQEPQDESSCPPCAKCVELSEAGDYIRKEREGAERRYRFPTLCVHGTGCHGYTAISFGLDLVERPDLALQVALIQHGYATMRQCDNSPPTHACRCKERLAAMGDVLGRLGAVEDGGWVGSKSGRCITDFTRTIAFSHVLTAEERAEAAEYLQRKGCPGNHGVSALGRGTAKLVFVTTMDSSD